MRTVKIGKFWIGEGRPSFIIAEAGVNHNGSLSLAKKLVDAAKKAGADAVKFQTFKTEKLVIRDAAQFHMLQKLELSKNDFQALFKHCLKRRILFLSSPFDEVSADLLEELETPAFKIGSGEITHFPLLEHIARKRRPIILSTGMSNLKEVRQAVEVIQRAGCRQLILLHCVSNYPANPKDVNLKAMETMRREFRMPVGFSDHTLGVSISLAAAALGACVIEKHLTLNRKMKGPDHAASLEPGEFAGLVKGIRTVESALGDGQKIPARSEQNTALVARRSLVAADNIEKGQVIHKNLVQMKRPGTGLKPVFIKKVIGKTAKKNIKAGDLFSLKALR